MNTYDFCVPVSGQEMFSVEANSWEESLEKVYKENYSVKPTLDDINWDFGLGRYDTEAQLKSCCIVSEVTEEKK